MSTDVKKDFGPATVTRMSRRVECLGPGKNVLMPDIYADEYAVKETVLEIVDESSPDEDRSNGINPYKTVVLF